MTTTPSISAPEETWLPVMGYPITEPFWAKEPVAVAGQPRAVLVQLFERRAGAPGGCGEGTRRAGRVHGVERGQHRWRSRGHQSRAQTSARAIRQQINWSAALQVNQDRRVGAAFAAAPVIHPQNPWRRGSRLDKCSEQSQQGVPAGRHPQPLGQRGPRLPAEGQGNLFQHGPLLLGAAGVVGHQQRDALGKDLAVAGLIAAAKAVDPQAQADRPPAQGNIGDGTVVVTMDTAGLAGTDWAGRRTAAGGDDERDALRVDHRLLHA